MKRGTTKEKLLLYPLAPGLYLSPQDNAHLLRKTKTKAVLSAKPNKRIRSTLKNPNLFDHDNGRS